MSPYVDLKAPHVCFLQLGSRFRIRIHCFGGATLQLATGAAGSAWFIVVGSSLVHHCLFIVGVSSVYDWFDFGLLWFIIGSSLVVRININHRWYRVDTSMLLAEPVKMAHH